MIEIVACAKAIFPIATSVERLMKLSEFTVLVERSMLFKNCEFEHALKD